MILEWILEKKKDFSGKKKNNLVKSKQSLEFSSNVSMLVSQFCHDNVRYYH